MVDIPDNKRCEICGKRRNQGNHFSCSKKRQQQYEKSRRDRKRLSRLGA